MVHAFVRCDTSSEVHAQGNLLILKLFDESKTARKKPDMFLLEDRTPDINCEAGITIFIMLFYGKDSDSFTDLG